MKVNTELVNNIGNFINRYNTHNLYKKATICACRANCKVLHFCIRTLAFLKNNYESTVPKIALEKKDIEFIEQTNIELRKFITLMEKIKLREGLKQVLAISSLGNSYFQSGEPWKYIKGNEAER